MTVTAPGTAPGTGPARRRRILLGAALAVGLVLAGLVGPGSTTAAPAPERAATAATGVAGPPGAALARPRAEQRPERRRTCRAKKRHRTEVVTAKRGAKAGRRAGRKALRRCRAARAPVVATPTSPTTGPGAAPGTDGGLVDPPVTPSGDTGPVPTQVTTTDACLVSVPDPGTTAPVEICYTLFRPAGSGAASPVPLVMHSHGWGGQRTTEPAEFADLLAADYAVLSFDQRGFGESGGQAYVENPEVEGRDVRALVAVVAGLDWVLQDAPGDPRMAGIGGSYGGGFQLLGAFESQRRYGRPLFDALAPEITWNDLQESLAPEGVTRTTWATALTAAAVPSQAMPTEVVAGLTVGAATNTFPDSLVPFFAQNGPQFHTERGRVLDVPVLLGQGTTDSLFPLEQGFQNFRTAITPAARARSIFVGYNGGHVLPAVLPMGVDVTSDPCSERLAGGDFAALTLRFLDEQVKGVDTGLTGYGAYHLATPQSTCLSVGSVSATTTVTIDDVITPALVGPPVATEVMTGPVRLAGTPYLTAAVTSVGLENRTFLGLAVGSSPATARLVQNNVLPLREPAPVFGEQRRIALPSIAVEVPAGQQLYLLSSPVDTAFTLSGSRTPGLLTLRGAEVHLPVVSQP